MDNHPLHPSMLLATKVQPPRSARRLVFRSRLMVRLSAIWEHRLTLISAAAGAGKTTLLSEWTAAQVQEGRLVAWVSLDARDNAPHCFWNYISAALAGLDEGMEAALPTASHELSPSELEAHLTLLLNGLATRTQDFALVLDEYQVITEPAIQQSLIFLLEHLPNTLHVVLLTRVEPPFPLVRMRGRGQLLELHTAELHCTLEETTLFLTQMVPMPLTSAQVLTLAAGTKGWLAGLQFVALTLQGRLDPTPLIEDLNGSQRFIQEYLITEVLQQQPEPIQMFLMQTSLLDQFSGPLCDALTQGSNSQELLMRLERANLFLAPCDEHGMWYRYHPLFADVLRLRLQQFHAAQVPLLHRRASAWFAQQYRFPQALQHVLAAGDTEHAVKLLEQRGFSLAIQGQVHLVQRWLHEIPETVLQTHPLLCLLSAMILMFTNQWDRALSRLHDAEACLSAAHADNEVSVIRGGIAVLHANIAYYAGDFTLSRQLAHQALAVLDPASGIERIARTGALVTAAHAYLITGDVSRLSESEVEGAIAAARAAGNLFPIVASTLNLAHLQTLQGKLSHAVTTYQAVEQLVPEQVGMGAVPSSPACAIGKGMLLYEWNDLDGAENALTQGLGALKSNLSVNAEVVTQGYLTFARLHMARGQHQHAQETLSSFLQLAHDHAFAPHLAARGAAMSAQIALHCGNVAATIRWAATNGLSAEDVPTFAYERDYLTLARMYLMQGRSPAQRFLLDHATRVLENLLADAHSKERVSSEIEILLLRAQVFHARGEDRCALADMEAALALAAPGRYLRIFLDEGEPIAALLKQIMAGKGTEVQYTWHILQQFPHERDVPLPSAREVAHQQERLRSLREPLSARELEVLRLMASGASTQATAEALVITVNTVRRHIGHIFNKLEVHSRVQATAYAHDRKLL